MRRECKGCRDRARTEGKQVGGEGKETSESRKVIGEMH